MNEEIMIACPRCGSAPELVKLYDNTEITTAKCSNADCKHSSVTGLDESMSRKLWNIRAGGRQPTTSETAETKHVGISDLLASIVKIEKQVAEAENRTAFGCMMDAKKGREHLAWLEILRRITGARKQLEEMLANDGAEARAKQPSPNEKRKYGN